MGQQPKGCQPGQPLVAKASERGRTEVVKLLLDQPGVDPSTNNNYPIRDASQKGHVNVVKLLLKDPRVDPAANNNAAIQYASLLGNTELVKLLLKDLELILLPIIMRLFNMLVCWGTQN